MSSSHLLIDFHIFGSLTIINLLFENYHSIFNLDGFKKVCRYLGQIFEHLLNKIRKAIRKIVARYQSDQFKNFQLLNDLCERTLINNAHIFKHYLSYERKIK